MDGSRSPSRDSLGDLPQEEGGGRQNILSTVFSDDGDNTPQNQDRDVFNYDGGSTTTLNRATQHSSMTDLSVLTAQLRERGRPRTRRGTYSDALISMADELSKKWDQTYGDIVKQGEVKVTEQPGDVAAEQSVIADIIRRNLTGSVTPPRSLSLAIYELSALHGDVLRLADHLQVSIGDEEGAGAFQIDDVTKMLEAYLKQDSVEELAKILFASYGREFIDKFSSYQGQAER